MHYISSATCGVAPTRAVASRQSHIRSPRRAAADAADNSFVDSISCRLVVPTQVFVEDASIGRLHLVKLGFTISLPPRVALHWIRFTVRVALVGGGVSEGGSPQIASLYPTRVATGTIVRGRIASAQTVS
jgi:hypothetical protein